MPNINETISRVEKLDPELAQQIRRYVKDHSYGLVFEENLPEAVRLFKKKACPGDVVNILPPRGKTAEEENTIPWVVKAVKDGVATIQSGDEIKNISTEEVVVTVSYCDTIYPGLKEIDRIENGNPDDSFHMVINAENYHALQTLVYAYAGKVDCIYIDPPYNTGAKDWKYNNDYVGQEDQYRHSKWLAFMKRRLKLAKQLLNPENSVLIVTIDEKEYLRLGMLLEQMFPEARMQMISSNICFKGQVRKHQFSRVDEYIFIVEFGSSSVSSLPLSAAWSLSSRANTDEKQKVSWMTLRRTGSGNRRKDRPKLYYPIYVSKDGLSIKQIGNPLDISINKECVPEIEGTVLLLPELPNGQDGRWQLEPETLKSLYDQHFVRIAKTGSTFSISYLMSGTREKLRNGEAYISGYREDGSAIVKLKDIERKWIPGSQWRIPSHDASEHGTKLLHRLLADRTFPYPKSLYAVEDVLRFFIADKPDALVVDFFAGSGTTAHATMLLNHLDGGHRRSISITNNEISAEEEKKFLKEGLRPGDPEWEARGIANYVTWPRIKAAITGINTLGEPIKEDYKFNEEFPMSEGFKENAVFCELTYESAWPIRLDNAFDAIAPILWMQAGCRGPVIKKIGKAFSITPYYGVLFNFEHVSKFCDQVKKTPSIKTVFVVTDDQRRFSNVCRRLPGIEVHRLYETYLRTFEICGEGGLD